MNTIDIIREIDTQRKQAECFDSMVYVIELATLAPKLADDYEILREALEKIADRETSTAFNDYPFTAHDLAQTALDKVKE